MRHSLHSFQRTCGAALAAAVVFALGAPAAGQGIDIETAWALGADAVHPGSEVRGALHITIEDRYHVHSNAPLDEFLIPTTLSFSPPADFTVRGVVYPEAVRVRAEFSDVPLAVFENDFVIGFVIEVGADAEPGRRTIEAQLGYQACDDKVCLQPSRLALELPIVVVPPDAPVREIDSPLLARVEFSAETGGTSEPPETVEPPETAEPVGSTGPPAASTTDDCDVVLELDGFTVLATAGGYLGRDDFLDFVERAETGTAERNLLEGRGPLAILLLVTLGGIALNLTPCVLPLIPINLAIIGAGAQAGSRARGFALGGTYGLAMAVVYGVLGLVVILTTSTFGAINSTIWFNVGIAVLFVLLALAMFDVIAIDFTRFQSKLDMTGKAKRGTFALAFGMGAIAALLAGACVAPVVIQVIVYAGDQYARGVTIALALPFFLGFGMALPWPFAGAGLSFLPKPGAWMVRVKQAMGLFILAFAVYYGYLAWQIYESRHGTPGPADGTDAHEVAGWTSSICEGFATARAEDRLVLVDMWATWCKNCSAMDKSTFRDEAVLARLDGYVKVRFQAEDLEATPAREVLERFEGIGLPTYAILRPRDGG